MGKEEALILKGKVDRIGLEGSQFTLVGPRGEVIVKQTGKIGTHLEALQKWQECNEGFDAVGHRIVHGGSSYAAPCVVSDAMIASLKNQAPFDPDHLPDEIGAIEWFLKNYPDTPQVACFDTYFHKDIPSVAKHFAIPRRFWEKGLCRFGFHGLSYEYVLQELKKSDPKLAAQGKIIIAHLGNGASMAAIKEGRCIDTSMGFTPIGGLIMSSRSGDLDPGVLLYMQKELGLSVDDLSRVLNKESGLRGISDFSGDMQDLLAAEGKNPFASEAIDMFCYQAKKYLGAYQHILGGLDALVFTGGIGENSKVIRDRISHSLSDVKVQVIETNEELMIARHTFSILV